MTSRPSHSESVVPRSSRSRAESRSDARRPCASRTCPHSANASTCTTSRRQTEQYKFHGHGLCRDPGLCRDRDHGLCRVHAALLPHRPLRQIRQPYPQRMRPAGLPSPERASGPYEVQSSLPFTSPPQIPPANPRHLARHPPMTVQLPLWPPRALILQLRHEKPKTLINRKQGPHLATARRCICMLPAPLEFHQLCRTTLRQPSDCPEMRAPSSSRKFHASPHPQVSSSDQVHGCPVQV